MLKNLLILPEGTKLFSGSATENAIQSVTLTQCVNSEVELTIGSTCANMLEATLITPNGGLSLTAGDEVTLFKVDENTLHKVGVFILEKPTRPTAHTMKLTGYDRVTKLDKDLTEWLKGLDGWPYNILTFATMVCDACGVTFVPNVVPNQDYAVEQFTKSGVTGRQIMKWIGEVCCRFIRANADGKIEMGWYEPLTTHAIGYKEGAFISVSDDGAGNVTIEGVDIQTSADDQGNVTINSDFLTVKDDGQGNVVLTVQDLNTLVYFQNGLSYEEYSVAPVEAVQIQLADSSDAYRWPEVQEGTNSYVISGNPMLNSTTDAVRNALLAIHNQLASTTYTPCKVSLPASLEIQPGHVVKIVDKNTKSLSMLVMSKTTAGQKDTFECTGSPRRDSTTAQNNKPVDVDAVAQQAVNSQTQEDIFNKLTNGGKAQGVYLKDGLLYINAEYIKSGKIAADYIDVQSLKVDAAQITGVLDAERIDGSTLNITKGATITGWNVGDNVLSAGTAGTDNFIGLYSSYPSASLTIGNVKSNNWRIVAGKKFGVTKDGMLSAADVDISGKITATSGFIGGWTLTKGETSAGTKYSSLTSGSIGGSNSVHLYTAYIGSSVKIGGHTGSDWRLTIGSKFGVDKDGYLYCTGGNIGGWTISDSELSGTSSYGKFEISPNGVTGLFYDPDDGRDRTDTISWYRILSAAMAWEG